MARGSALALLLGGLIPALALPASAATSAVILTNQTTPHGGVVLRGTDGQYHIWTSDHINGVCRVDQNADGTWSESDCLLAFAGSPAIKPGQLAFDGTYLYLTDLSSKSMAWATSPTTPR